MGSSLHQDPLLLASSEGRDYPTVIHDTPYHYRALKLETQKKCAFKVNFSKVASSGSLMKKIPTLFS